VDDINQDIAIWFKASGSSAAAVIKPRYVIQDGAVAYRTDAGGV
jgi:hypothetical protein